MNSFDFKLPTRLVFGPGTFERIGDLSRELGLRRPLIVADSGLEASGHVDRAVRLLRRSGMDVETFSDFKINPNDAMIERGVRSVAPLNRDAIIGLGGGSSLDFAKGINLLLTNGGRIAEYQGYGHVTRALLPMIAVPTTAGTGSEAQSYAVISDSKTHIKMACGDQKMAFSVALLDPELTFSQPSEVTAAAGFDAIAHAVETSVTTRRTDLSMLFSREAFRLLNRSYESVLDHPNDLKARGAMHLGAFYAGLAIEQSMLGAAHACANPLTAQYQLTHGVALGILLPHIVRWNAAANVELYGDLTLSRNNKTSPGTVGDDLADRLVEISRAGGFPANLRTAGVRKDDLVGLAEVAGQQWTGTFNPRPFSSREALEVYQCAF